MKLGVSVVSRNRPDTLRQTVAALVGTLPADTPVVIVDNGSDPVWLRDEVGIPQLENWHVIRNTENLGLSRAVNQGLSALYDMGCEVLVHLDDDALVTTQNWASWFCEKFTSCPELGLALPNIHWYSEHIQHQEYNELRWGLGFCWAIRRETYDIVGGYDVQLLHQQECDYALRVRMANYTVGAVSIDVTHNSPPPEPVENWRVVPRMPTVGEAREHLGCVQFRDKWTSYFRGRGWSYGTTPLYFMQHWPPDQNWYERFARVNGIDLNPPPPERRTEAYNPGATLGITPEEAAAIPRKLQIGPNWYMAYVELRNDFAHWVHGDAYLRDRDDAIENWFKLTGERYVGYQWPFNALKCI